jgi:hypothetical protein
MLHATANVIFLVAGFIAFQTTRRTMLERKLDMVRAFRGQR